MAVRQTMRPFKETMPLEQALALLHGAIEPIDRTEAIALEEATGRVIARDAVSAVDVPPFDRAAMDGYAVVAEDTFGVSGTAPRALVCVGTLHSGDTSATRIESGQCLEIATGAPIPTGANAVVMVEETERADEISVRVLTPVYPRQHVGRQGADITTGQVVAAAGTLLNPSRIGALAATGVAEVEVYAKPRVAIFSTGNEIVSPGNRLMPGQLYDINRLTLTSVTTAHGGVAVAHPPVRDTIDALERAVESAADADLLVFSGGSSVGEHDLIVDVVDRLGTVLFHGIAVKPGKPTLFGRIGGRPVLGMPGYATSCLSNAYVLLIPALRRLARLPDYRPHTVHLPLSRRVASTTGRHQFYTVRVEQGTAVPAFKASGDITSMSQADGYIEIAAQTTIVEAGEVVEVKLF